MFLFQEGHKRMKLILRLYISDDKERNAVVIANYNKIVQHFNGTCLAEIIDIQKDPKSAVTMRITATPALIKISPPPRVKIIGDLSDITRVISLIEMVN